jgi:hypothetical protein
MILRYLCMLVICVITAQALDVCPGSCQDKESCEVPLRYDPPLRPDNPDNCRRIDMVGTAAGGFASAVIWPNPEHEVRLSLVETAHRPIVATRRDCAARQTALVRVWDRILTTARRSKSA